MGAADPGFMEEDREGLPLGAPKGTGTAMVVEGGGHRVSFGVFGEHAGGMQGVGRGGQS